VDGEAVESGQQVVQMMGVLDPALEELELFRG
jgi:hypothetical protein